MHKPQKKTFNDSDFVTLYSSPDSYVGSNVNITGKIFNFPPSRTGEPKALQMYQAGNRDRNVVVFYKGNGLQLSENDCVRVVGTSAMQQQYANTFGATLTAAIINANSVNKIDCINAINPAKKTVFVKEIQEKGGIKLLLDKVEFSDKNTRAYLNVSSSTNNTDDVHFYDSQSKAVQGNRQFGTTYSFDVDYPKIKSDILPGITENGIVLFEPLNATQNHAKFIFETSVGYSNNYRFAFDVNLNDTGTINKKPYNKSDIGLNERVNNIVDFCINSLPNGTTTCDDRLGPLLNKICNGENNTTAQQSLDACHDGKVAQYYKVRNDEIKKRNTMMVNSNDNATKM